MCTLDDALCDQLARCSLHSELGRHIELWQRTRLEAMLDIQILTSPDAALILGAHRAENIDKIIDTLETKPNWFDTFRENADHSDCRCRMNRTRRRFVVEADIS